nr:HIRAN domain-containing protein [uncultured Sphingomonas sp.]
MADRFFIGVDDAPPILLQGSGQFDFPVVGEANYQQALSNIAGGRSEDSAAHLCAAIFAHDNANPHDDNAVAVVIEGKLIGYLPRDEARQFRTEIGRLNPDRGAVGCAALITGGWDRGDGDVGHFGVFLDVARPFRPMTGPSEQILEQ